MGGNRPTARSGSPSSRCTSGSQLRLPVPPRPPQLSTATRVAYSKRLTLSLRKIYPGRVTRSFASAHGATSTGTLRLWQERSAAAALLVSAHAVRRAQIDASLNDAFLCIHHYEGSWTANTGNGYYGGLQMDRGFMQRYGADFIGRWGTADNSGVGAARSRGQGARLGTRLHAVAQHRSLLRPLVALKARTTRADE